jgi:hypothetical protein
MIVLDAIPQPNFAMKIRTRPNSGLSLVYGQPELVHTASGSLPGAYQQSLITLTYEAESITSQYNDYLRALSIAKPYEMAVYFTEHQITEPVEATRLLVPGLVSTFGLNVSYFPVFYGVVSLQEIQPIRGCGRSLWAITFTETRKLKPEFGLWGGVLPDLGALRVKTVGSGGSFDDTDPFALTAIPLNWTWYRRVSMGAFNTVLQDTRVIRV